jgi:hypothetical protein
MLSKCANPACAASFRYLREGKVFVADGMPDPASAESDKTCWRRTEMFWLCEDCSKQLTLTRNGNSVVPVAKGKRPESETSLLRELRIYG